MRHRRKSFHRRISCASDDESIPLLIVPQSRRGIMSIKSKLVLAAALLAASVASPALAQSFDPDVGTGNIVAGNPAPASQVDRSGLRAYAMVSERPATSIAAWGTGGGSVGYNDLLFQH
jgi:hypothetical protein